MIDFNALEEALDSIKEIGDKTITFDLKGTPVTLRMIRPHEEIEVQKWAITSVEEEKSQATLAEYLDRIKIGTLSYVLVGIGDQNFDTDIIVTDEKLQNGKPIKHKKHTYLRQKLATWSRPLVHNIYKKFGELVEIVEAEAESAIEFDPPDLEAEIERREENLKALREKLSEREKEEDDFRSKQIRAAINLEKMTTPESIEEFEQTQQIIEKVAASHSAQSEPEPEEEWDEEDDEGYDYQPTEVIERGSDLRQNFDNRNAQSAQHRLQPEDQDLYEDPEYDHDSRVQQSRPQVSRVQQSRPQVETQSEDYGSFVPPDNQARQRAIQEEQQRLLQERQARFDARQEARRQEQTGARRYSNVQAQPPQGPRTGRVPPHARAAEVGKQISSVGGVPVFLPEGASEEDLFSQAIDGLENSSQAPPRPRPNTSNTTARRRNRNQKPRR